MSAAILSEASLVRQMHTVYPRVTTSLSPNHHEIHFLPLNVIMYTYETIISYTKLLFIWIAFPS